MKFYDKLYVGIEKSRYENTDNQRLLGFATPIEDNAAYAKRKETVDRWRDTSVEPLIIENKPIFGFEIVDVVSRYKTDNKLYRILDPRGFELEISAENLFAVLMNNTIVEAKIMEPMLWARSDSGKNYLISGSSEQYLHFLKPKKTVALEEGQWFTHPGNKNLVYRYEGKFHYCTIKSQILTYNPSEYNYWGNRPISHPMQARGGIQTWVKFEAKNDNKEPYEIYTEFRLNEAKEIVKYCVHMRKSKLKDLEYFEEGIETNFKIPTNKFLYDFMLEYGPAQDYGSMVGFTLNGYGNSPSRPTSDVILFKTRKEAQDFKVTIGFINDTLKPTFEYKYENGINKVVSSVQKQNLGTVFYELFHNDKLIEVLG